MSEQKTDSDPESEEDRKKQKKGDQPPPAKVEAKRQEQSGKTFQQTGTEKRG